MPEDYRIGRIETAPTLAIILSYYFAGEKQKADSYLREIEKALIKSRFYPGTMGMPALVNKTRYPDDPTDVHNVSVYSSAWYIFVKKISIPSKKF